MTDRADEVREALEDFAFTVDAARMRRESAFVHHDALEVLCRVFDDGADERFQKWLAWYDPAHWIHPARALGAFIRRELEAERALSRGTPSEDAVSAAIAESVNQETGFALTRAEAEAILEAAYAVDRPVPSPPAGGEERTAAMRVMEEAAEVIVAASKVARFGANNWHPDDPLRTPNMDAVQREAMDTLEAVDALKRLAGSGTPTGDEGTRP